MASLIQIQNASGPRLMYVNSAPSSVITNTASETAFDQVFTFPSAAQHYIQPIGVVRLKANGVISTGLLNLGLTLRIRWGGIGGTVICTTGSFNAAASLSSAGWQADATLLITSVGSAGSMEVQGAGSFTSGVLSVAISQMANAAPMAIDTTVPNDVVITAQWGTAAAANQIQIRTFVAEVDGP